MRKPAKAAPPHPAARVKLSVLNGDLSFVHGPVVVGHFLGDSISGAEAELDFALGGALRRRYLLGLYPGSPGSAVVAPSTEGNGAIGVVVGLGDIGALNPGTIRTALLAGLLELAVSPGWRGGAVTIVLLGSRAGTLSISDTLAAMLAAISEAQRRLAERGITGFHEARFISVYEDDAHRLWHTLRRFLTSQRYRAAFELESEIAYGPGAQRRLMRMEDPDSWRAISVTGTVDAAGKPDGFRFTAAGDRARAEGYTVAADRGFLKQFLGAAEKRKLDVAPTRALFQLVWPAELKQASLEDRNLRLILDEAAAALPFELMDDREAGDGDDAIPPPAVRRGLLRQLVQTRFARLQATPPRGRRALVIGDPRGGPHADDFPPLPGAVAEAEAVARRLEREGYEVVKLIGDGVTPDKVVETLLEGGWTLLHICAHGVYDYPFRSDRKVATAGGWDGDWEHYQGPRYTGIVLGDRLTLTPSILQSLPEPPVFAFINCCNLATVDVEDEARLRAAGRPDFAAGFAAELIGLGTRAVIAAGWEVSDQGALTFAKSIYRELLGNSENFGDAVRIARGDVFAAEPEDASWGAYQCYGEPDWRLRGDGDARPKPARHPVFASPAEALAAIEGVRNRAIVGGEREDARAGLLAELAALEHSVAARHWQGREGLAEQLGHAAMAMGEEERAIGWFETALAQDSAPSLRLLESLARLRLREAIRESGTDAGAPETALARIEAVREQLTLLCAIAGSTAQRLSLIGKAANRAALLLAGEARDGELARMRDAYRQAWKLSREEKQEEGFRAGLMAVTAGILIALRADEDAGECRREIEELMADFTAGHAPPGHWKAVGEVAHGLLGALVDRGGSPASAEELAARLRGAWERVGADAGKDPLIEPMRLIAAVLDDRDSTRPIAQWVASIEHAAATGPAAV
jgi:CHAT domain-containing protein